MKSKLCIIGCMLAALSSLYFIDIQAFTSTAVSRLLFKLLLFSCFFSQRKVYSTKVFYLFFGVLILTDVCSLGVIYLSTNFYYVIAALFGFGYVLLLEDAYAKFKIFNVNSIIGIYYFFVIGINAILMIYHLYNLYGYLVESPWLYMVQVGYNILMFLMIMLALAYYLNSYSKKSMYFLIGTLAFVSSDILISAYYFYNIRENLVFLHSVLGMIGYLFFFNYFFTPEQPQLIEKEILEELRSRKTKS